MAAERDSLVAKHFANAILTDRGDRYRLAARSTGKAERRSRRFTVEKKFSAWNPVAAIAAHNRSIPELSEGRNALPRESSSRAEDAPALRYFATPPVFAAPHL
jgi:hypothetical protein